MVSLLIRFLLLTNMIVFSRLMNNWVIVLSFQCVIMCLHVVRWQRIQIQVCNMSKKWKSMANITNVIVSDNREWDPSVTQPDETLSIREILHRVSQGMTTGLGDQVPGDYDEDNDDDFGDPTLDPEFDKLDALAISTSEEADQLRDEEKDRQRKRRKKKEDEDFQRRVDEEIARRSQQPDSSVS